MRLINLTLWLVHLCALTFFALKYLRFDVKSSGPYGGNQQQQQQQQKQQRSPMVSKFNAKIDEEIFKLNPTNSSISEPKPKPKFDRFVFFLLDAWRWNFFFNEEEECQMNFLKNKVMKEESVGLVSLARIPTVTKPCLKSIFAGTFPVFFEIVENIDESGMTENLKSSTATTVDNLLHRLHERGKKLAVYGDDVWSKLFSMDIFYRSNVSFGFNIMDYIEVDNLVHRGLEVEMEKSKESDGSDILILHYLGLDHIGHSYAAKPEFIKPKLKEMDGKIKEIYEWIERRDNVDGKKTLMLVMGDHGMTKEGNHGGGSKDEVQAGAVFLSPHFKKNKQNSWPGTLTWKEIIETAERAPYHQEDIAATLTALLDSTGTGNPLKFGSGCLIEKVMRVSFDDEAEERALLLGNLKHLLTRLTGRDEDIEILISKITGLEDIDSNLSNKMIYELSEGLKGILNADNFTFEEEKLKLMVAIMGGIVLIFLVQFLWNRKMCWNLESLAELGGIVTLGLCQGATSFIAEEHVIWQGMFMGLTLIWGMKMKMKNESVKENDKEIQSNRSLNTSTRTYAKIALLLLMHRILCGWNGVGTMWGNQITMGSLIKSNDLIEIFSVAVGLVWILIIAGVRLKREKNKGLKQILELLHITGVACLIVFLHKIGLKNSIPGHVLAQTLLVILITEKIYKKDWNNLDISMGILCVLLNKPVNAIPVAGLMTMMGIIGDLEGILGPSGSLMRMSLMQGSFYALGLWNSVSAVDLTFGAIFSKSFNMTTAPVVLLMYCWSGPVLVAISFKNHFTDRGQISISTNSNPNSNRLINLMFFRGFLDFMACAFAFHHRFHAWIFDFFSPKILFQVFWAAFYLIALPLIDFFK